jgi:hypothetical protein
MSVSSRGGRQQDLGGISLSLLLLSAAVGGALFSNVISGMSRRRRYSAFSSPAADQKNSKHGSILDVWTYQQQLSAWKESVLMKNDDYQELLINFALKVTDNMTKNFPLWIGSYWLLYKQQAQQKQQQGWLLDSLVLGLLLASTSTKSSTKKDNDNNSKHDDSSFLHSVVQSSVAAADPLGGETTTKPSKDSSSSSSKGKERYVELLVHNVSAKQNTRMFPGT